MRRVALVGVLVVALITGVVLWLGSRDEAEEPAPRAEPPSASAEPVTTPSPSPVARTTTKARPKRPALPSCPKRAPGAFDPTTVLLPGSRGAVTVIAPPRDANGVPGVPPLTSAGKSLFAWDREQGIRPGDPRGNVLLNAHTWPDGSALGNRLLSSLQEGEQILVQGSGARLCYRVTERVEVPGDVDMPRYFATDGEPQVAIVVCSGRRLGPGHWENRTIWFASPTA